MALSAAVLAAAACVAVPGYGGGPERQLSWLFEGPCIAVLEHPNISNPPFIGYSGRLVYAQPRDCFNTDLHNQEDAP